MYLFDFLSTSSLDGVPINNLVMTKTRNMVLIAKNIVSHKIGVIIDPLGQPKQLGPTVICLVLPDFQMWGDGRTDGRTDGYDV